MSSGTGHRNLTKAETALTTSKNLTEIERIRLLVAKQEIEIA